MDTHPARLASLVARKATPPFLPVSAAERGRGPAAVHSGWDLLERRLTAARSDALNFKHRRHL